MTPTGARLRHHLGYSGAAVIGSTVISALGGAVGARVLGPGGKGAYALWVLLATAVGSLGTGGLEYWVNRAVAGDHGVDPRVRQILVRHLRIVLCTAALVTVAALSVEVGVTGTPRSEAFLAVAFAVCWVVSMLGLAVTSGLLRMRRLATWMLAGATVYLVWSLVLWVQHVSSVSWFLAGAAVGNLVPALSCIGLLHEAAESDEVAKQSYGAALRFGLPGAVGDLVTFAALRADVFLVALWLGVPAAGIYAVASAVGEVALLIPNSVSTALLPRAAAHRAWSSRQLVLITAVIAAGVAVVLAVTAVWTVPLVFGSAFRPAAPVVAWLAPAAAALGLARVMNADLTAHGRSGVRAVAAVAGVAVMAAVDAAAVRPWGLSGAGLGALVGSGAAAGLTWWFWHLHIRSLPAAKRPEPAYDSAALVVG